MREGITIIEKCIFSYYFLATFFFWRKTHLNALAKMCFFPLGIMVKVLLYFPPGEDIAVATTNHHPDILSPFAARDGLVASGEFSLPNPSFPFLSPIFPCGTCFGKS